MSTPLEFDGRHVTGLPPAPNVAAIASPSTPVETAMNSLLAWLQEAGLMEQSAPVSLAFVADPSDVPVGDPMAPAQVAVYDDLGNFLADDVGTEVTVALTVPGGATLGGTLSQPTVDGIATFGDLTVDTAATGYTLDASAGSVGPVTSDPFDVAAPVAAGLGFGVQPTASRNRVPIAPSVTVEILDQAGALLASDSTTAVTVALAAAGGATLGGTLTRTAAAGVATFDDLTVDRGGFYALRATTPGLASTTSEGFAVARVN